jgi:uncharacterized membrane protein YfcA
LNLLFFWVRTVILGIIAGSILLNFISTEELKIYFSIYLLCVTLYSIFQPESKLNGEGTPPRFLMRIAGFFVGGISVLLGIGGGTFTVPFFKFSQYPLKKAIALSTATSLVVGFGGTIGVLLSGLGAPGRTPYSWGFVNIPAFILLTPGMMIFSPLGARTANHLPNRSLKALYISFFALMTLYMGWKVSR